MIRFAEVFPDAKIVHALRAQLGWTHFRQIIYLDAPLKRNFYAEMCRIENWNTRTLEENRRNSCLPVQARPDSDATKNDAVVHFIVATDRAGFCFWPAN